MVRNLLIALVIATFITGCAGPSFAMLDPSATCNEIVHPALLSVPFEEVASGREEAEEWILTEFPTATVEFTPSQDSGDDEIGGVYWVYYDKHFDLNLQYGVRYIRQFSEYFKPRMAPTLGQLIRCYGEPEYYSLAHVSLGGEATDGVRLDLWYPTDGLYFESVTWGINSIHRYNINSPIVGDRFVMPIGTVEEMIRNSGVSIEHYIGRKRVVKKWPENFTELVLEEEE